jgi:hypothetical protein
MKYNFRYLILLLTIFVSQYLSAIPENIQIPPKRFVWDYAHIMRDSVPYLEGMAADNQTFRRYNSYAYIVTVPVAYRPYMDNFIKSVCDSWHICNYDQSVLMVMTDGDQPYIYVHVGSMNHAVNDTIAGFWAEKDFPLAYKMSGGPVSTAINFQESVSSALSVPDFSITRSEYTRYADNYKGGPQNKEDHIAPPVITSTDSWKVGLFACISLLILLINRIQNANYKSKVI